MFSGDFVSQAEYWICCLMVLFCGSMYVKLPWQGICWFFLFTWLFWQLSISRIQFGVS
jgi:hypothetical protein